MVIKSTNTHCFLKVIAHATGSVNINAEIKLVIANVSFTNAPAVGSRLPLNHFHDAIRTLDHARLPYIPFSHVLTTRTLAVATMSRSMPCADRLQEIITMMSFMIRFYTLTT